MKQIILTVFMSVFVFGGFYTDETKADKLEVIEAQRLCNLFTQKAENYEKTMRDDDLARQTLVSYQQRAKLYCDKAKALEKSL
ncbi:MAG: hypothetical protein IE885_07885 [Campylobacterales bacterium]|nr:hypothetical protein [Campylobacterales bacterium]